MDEPYEITIIVKRGIVVGGGLPNLSYVTTSIDGFIIDTTESLPSPPVWNQTIKQSFPTLEPTVPIIISFSMYKKRWTAAGYKLVGSIQFPINDLSNMINKGPIEKEFNLHINRKNLTLTGSLVVSFDVNKNQPVQSTFEAINEALTPNLPSSFKEKYINAFNSNTPVKSLIAALTSDVFSGFLCLENFDNKKFGFQCKILFCLMAMFFLYISLSQTKIIQKRLESTIADIESVEAILKEIHRNKFGI